jgi:membrane fusion protein, multidrug efflux system
MKSFLPLISTDQTQSPIPRPWGAQLGREVCFGLGMILVFGSVQAQPKNSQAQVVPAPSTPAIVPKVIPTQATPTQASPSPSTGAGQMSPPSATPVPEALGVRVLLTPELETVLVAQMVGRITELNASLGSRVNKGQVVVSFDCSENTAKLKMSEAELASARDSYDNKLRLKGLDAAGDVEVSLAAAQVDRAKGQIEMTKAQIQGCTVLAPFSGSVSKLNVKPHQGVSLGQQLFEMVSDGTPRLRLNVPSKWMRTLKIGNTFSLTIEETGKSYKGNVAAINTRVDPIAQTIEIEGRVLGKAQGLLPGMSGIARFSGMPAL